MRSVNFTFSFYLKQKFTMSYLKKEKAAIVNDAKSRIRALNHPLRQNILNVIKTNGNKMNVTDIYKSLRLEQSVTSMHLGILRQGRFLKTKRDGRTIWYSVDDNAVKAFVKLWEKEIG